MATSQDRAGGSLSIPRLAEQMRSARIPVNSCFSYFSATPLSEDDLKDFIEEPVAALPPSLQALLPPVFLLLVPYIERTNGAETGQACFEEVPEKSSLPAVAYRQEDLASLALAIKARDLSDYHYEFYRGLAELVCERVPEDVLHQFRMLLRQELANDVNGEVDEKSWTLKQSLLRRKGGGQRDSKLFRTYSLQALIDTLTLYLHGICCDIDVETGPRQLRSQYLRKRLMLLEEAFPPPEGFAVFPEDLRGVDQK